MKVTIADILHHAADKKLAHEWSPQLEWYFDNLGAKYSCTAIAEAIEDLMGWEALYYSDISDRISKGLNAMGLNTKTLNAFKQWEKGDEDYDTQQARYGWLKLAALMAEEQGV
jgi:hypothetical protein